MKRERPTPIWIKIAQWITILLIAIYLLSAFIGYADPRHCGFLAIAGLAYPIILIMVILSALLWLLIRWRFALLPFAALLITIPQITAFSPIHYNRFWSGRKDGDFAMMTYNTFSFNGKERTNKIVNEILKYDADFVCLQEVPKIRFFKYRMDKKHLELLKRSYPYMEDSDSTSMCCFSKKPVRTVYSYHDDKYFAFCVYETEVLGNKAFVFNVHLESIGLTREDKKLYMKLTSVKSKDKSLRGVRSRLITKLSNAFKNRAGQAEMIRATLDSIRTDNPEAEIFVCGDFNDTPYSYSYLTIKGRMHDAYSDAGIGPTHTYNANRFYFHIDQMLYDNKRIEAISTRRGNSRASDHYPIICLFRKKDNQNN